MQPPALRRIESYFRGPRGHSLFRRVWLPAPPSPAAAPPPPERVVLLVHGLFEHSGRYEHLASWLAARRCAVHAYDQQGHGRSSGIRAHVRRFRDLLDDLEALVALVRVEHPGLPVFLVGHSMGGLVVASFLCERRPDLAAAVTSGAALALPDGVPRAKVLVARLMRWLAPRLSVDYGLDPECLSRDPKVVRAYVEDPLVTRRVTLSLAAELFSAVARTAGGAADVRVPLLLLHGEEDVICPPHASGRFHAQLGAPGRLRTYPRLRHEIFNEPEQGAVFEDVLEWLCKHPGKPGEACP